MWTLGISFARVPNQPDDSVISLTKGLDDRLADKTRCSRDKNFHTDTLLLIRRLREVV